MGLCFFFFFFISVYFLFVCSHFNKVQFFMFLSVIQPLWELCYLIKAFPDCLHAWYLSTWETNSLCRVVSLCILEPKSFIGLKLMTNIFYLSIMRMPFLLDMHSLHMTVKMYVYHHIPDGENIVNRIINICKECFSLIRTPYFYFSFSKTSLYQMNHHENLPI